MHATAASRLSALQALHINLSNCLHMHTCTHAHMHTRHMHTCTPDTCTHAHMHTCTYAHVYLSNYTHSLTHEHITDTQGAHTVSAGCEDSRDARPGPPAKLYQLNHVSLQSQQNHLVHPTPGTGARLAVVHLHQETAREGESHTVEHARCVHGRHTVAGHTCSATGERGSRQHSKAGGWDDIAHSHAAQDTQLLQYHSTHAHTCTCAYLCTTNVRRTWPILSNYYHCPNSIQIYTVCAQDTCHLNSLLCHIHMHVQ